MAELALEDCYVPETALLGREGRGAEIFNCSMAWERACIWQPALEQCDASSNAASNTLGSASNSGRRSADLHFTIAKATRNLITEVRDQRTWDNPSNS
jgi:hypothetical protein